MNHETFRLERLQSLLFIELDFILVSAVGEFESNP